MATDHDEFQRRFKAIQEGFVAELPAKHRQIRAHWQSLRGAWSQQRLQALYLTVHRLAGAGETFGFAELSERARQLDRLLGRYVAQDPPGAQQQQELEQALQALSALLETLTQARR